MDTRAPRLISLCIYDQSFFAESCMRGTSRPLDTRRDTMRFLVINYTTIAIITAVIIIIIISLCTRSAMTTRNMIMIVNANL